MKYVAIKTSRKVITTNYDPIYGASDRVIIEQCFIPVKEFDNLKKAQTWRDRKCRENQKILIIKTY